MSRRKNASLTDDQIEQYWRKKTVPIISTFSVYPSFSSNENAQNSNYVSVYYV